MSLWNELKRRNVVKVGAAYAVVAWLLVQVAATVSPQLNLPEWAPRLITLLLMLGFPIAVLVAWFLEHTPEGVKIEPASAGNKRVVAISLALAVVAVGWFLRERRDATVAPARVATQPTLPAPAQTVVAATRPADPRSIAVLPFVNLSSDPEQEYFADGLSEEILNSLTGIEGMRVAGRTSSFQFKGKAEDLRIVGAKLDVASVLEGSVRRGRDGARITAQLVRASDGFHLWSQTYDRTLDDVLAVQLDIAENVAASLDVLLDDAQRERLRLTGVSNIEAFIAFQKGRKLYADAHDPRRSDNLIGTLREARIEFERATALEPDFAAAYVLGTDLYSHIVLDAGTSSEERTSALEAARRDLALAARYARDVPTRLLAETDRQLLSDDWRGLAERIAAASRSQGCRQGNWLLAGNAMGVAAERVAAYEEQIACDPLSGLPYQNGAVAALWAGRPELALELVTRAESAMGGTGPIVLHGVRALLALGRVDEAQARLAGMPPGSAERAMAALLVAAATGGDVAGLAAQSRDDRHLGWNPGYWEVADVLAESLLDDREAANRRAASYDALPGGSLKLVTMLVLCQCGAPFDLDATPNFKARIAESGAPWPPPDLLANLRRRNGGAP